MLPYKTVHHRHSHRRHSSRPAHIHVIEERRHSSHLPLPPPQPLPLPAPAPVPVPAIVTVPPPAPSVHHHLHPHSHGPQLVEVIPSRRSRSRSRGRSSSSSSSSDGSYVYHREVRREGVLESPRQQEFETYQYVTSPEDHYHHDVRYRGGRSHSRSRSRSVSRARYVDAPHEKVKSTRIVLEDERPRRRNYHY